MRKWINILTEMSAAEARSVFQSFDVDADDMSSAELKSAYRRLMMKNHPDRGGDTATAQRITAAYDALKDSPKGFTASTTSYRADQPKPAPKADFHDLDYVKHWFAEKAAGQPTQNWTVMNFDGRFFRGMFTVPGNHDMFPDMARIMKIWDRFDSSRAIMVGTNSMLDRGTVAVISVDGVEVNPIINLHFDTFNRDPSNDQSFVRDLPRILDLIASGEFVSQTMLD